MKSPADIIVELESDNSRLYKESVICREMKNDNIEFFDGVKLCCDKLITFGVSGKTVPEKSNHHNIEGTNDVSFTEFRGLVDKLVNRTLTGNAARDALEELCFRTSYNVWNNWYRRILLKDLKCGVSEKTINNCSKKTNKSEFSIPVFSCQLAFDSNNYESKVSGTKIIETKLDGVRIITIVYPEGRVDQFSRNGKEILNFSIIKEQFKQIASSLQEPMVFDGEIMSSSFQDLMTQFYRKVEVNTKDSVLYLFDMIPLEQFKTNSCKIKQIERTGNLHKWYEINNDLLSNIKVLEYKILNLDDKSDQEKFYELNDKFIAEGYEGIMIKDPNASYVCKRSTSWLKLKPFRTLDLKIVNVQEGCDKYKGILGAIVCHGFDEEKEIFVNVGSGISDELRKHYWENKQQIIGKVAEIKFDCVTQNQNGTYSLRFPRFVRLRGFEIDEKM